MSTISISRDINLLKKEPVQERLTPINPLYNAWAEIDLGAIKHNLDVLRNKLGGVSDILVVVKANAYGHGLREVTKTVLESGVKWLGVTSITEAMELRRLYPSARVLILSAGMYAHSRLIVKHNLTPIVCSRQMAQELDAAGKDIGKQVKVHIKIDTGLGRLGAWYTNANPFIEFVAGLPYIEIEGICTHFSSASSNKVDLDFTRSQLHFFNEVVENAGKSGIYIPIRHIANSGAVLILPESHLNLVRVGISVYGLLPSKEFLDDIKLKPALSLKSRVAFIKDVFPGRTISYGRSHIVDRKTRIATIPIGYSNGYCRSLSNKGKVLINGEYAPVVGIVTMDQIMADIGNIPGVCVGSEVALIGKQKDKEITATEVACWADTISYEILCKLSVPRVYFPAEKKEYL